MNPENIKLSERRQTQKATHYVISLIRNAPNRQNLSRQKIDHWSPRAGGRKEIKLTANGYRVSFGGDANALELNLCTILRIY